MEEVTVVAGTVNYQQNRSLVSVRHNPTLLSSRLECWVVPNISNTFKPGYRFYSCLKEGILWAVWYPFAFQVCFGVSDLRAKEQNPRSGSFNNSLVNFSFRLYSERNCGKLLDSSKWKLLWPIELQHKYAVLLWNKSRPEWSPSDKCTTGQDRFCQRPFAFPQTLLLVSTILSSFSDHY